MRAWKPRILQPARQAPSWAARLASARSLPTRSPTRLSACCRVICSTLAARASQEGRAALQARLDHREAGLVLAERPAPRPLALKALKGRRPHRPRRSAVPRRRVHPRRSGSRARQRPGPAALPRQPKRRQPKGRPKPRAGRVAEPRRALVLARRQAGRGPLVAERPPGAETGLAHAGVPSLAVPMATTLAATPTTRADPLTSKEDAPPAR